VHAGAHVYYLRNILHDYPDEKALVILQNIIAVLGSESVILIDEMIIPNKGAHPHATEQDLMMMTTLALMERTQRQWSALLAKAGLKVPQQSIYNDDTSQAI
jgi:demethylsterigmatocystin 6-O-methyltransferase